MIYWKLFLTFLEIGAVCFGGGYGMISLIREKVLLNGWLTEEEILNMIAISESTPGPLAVNMATFIGNSQGGLLGAFLATFGVVLPSFIVILLIASLINNLLKAGYGKLYPIDSEHVAIYKLLKEHSLQEVDEIIITASGGSFRDLKRDQLENVTVEQALKHPSWKMGSKITIDSATMMNKGFEIMEAYYLFHFPLEKIKVLLHDESVIHSLIKLVDHSYHADLGPADMCIPISYALYEGNYHNVDVKDLSLEDLATLHFRKYDNKRYPCVEFAKKALLIGGSMGCVLNASNEVANRLFRENKIKFLDIEKIIMKVMSLHQVEQNPTLDDLIRINDWAEKTALSIYRGE